MKNNFLIAGLLTLIVLATFHSCKKDDNADESPIKIEGTFHAFEAQLDGGDIIPMPNQGEQIDIQVKKIKDNTAKVLFIDYYQNNKDTIPFNCKIGKTDDGFVILSYKTGEASTTVSYYDSKTIDLSITGNGKSVYVGAAKDGKKPDWWE